MESGNSKGHSSSRAQSAVVCTLIRWSFFAELGAGTGREAWSLRLLVAVSNTRVRAADGSFERAFVTAMPLLVSFGMLRKTFEWI